MPFYVNYVPTHGVAEGCVFSDEADDIFTAVGIAARRIENGNTFVEIQNEAGKVVISEKDLAGNDWVSVAQTIQQTGAKQA